MGGVFLLTLRSLLAMTALKCAIASYVIGGRQSSNKLTAYGNEETAARRMVTITRRRLIAGCDYANSPAQCRVRVAPTDRNR